MRKILNSKISFKETLKSEWVLLAGIILFSALLCALMLNPYLTVVNHDSAIFSLLGEAMASGKGYLLESSPDFQPYFTFPPFLPLMIAVWLRLSGNFDVSSAQLVIKGGIHLLFLLSIPLFYYWLRSHFSVVHARVLTLLLAVNPLVFKYSSDILSDVPYWAFSMIAFFFLQRWEQSKENLKIKKSEIEKKLFKGFKVNYFSFALGIVFILLSLWTRQVGVSLVLAFLTYLLFRKEWKLFLISALILALGSALWPAYEHHYRSTHHVAGETLNQAGMEDILDKSPIKLEFIKHFLVQNPIKQDDSHLANGVSEYAEIIVNRVVSYGKLATDQLLPPIKLRLNGEQKKTNIIYYLTPFFALFFILGLPHIFRAYPLMCFYLLIYLAVFSVYPYVSPRFLLPVFPFVLLILYQGILDSGAYLRGKLSKRLSPRVLKQSAIALMAVFIGLVFVGGHLIQTFRWVNAGYKLKIAQVGPSRRVDNRAYYEALLWIRENTPKDSLIITRKPPVSYYYGQRKSLAFPFTSDMEKLHHFILEKQRDYAGRYAPVYVLEDTAFAESERYLTPMLRAYSDDFSPVYRDAKNRGTTLWQVELPLLLP